MDREEDEVAELFGDFGGDGDGTDHCNDIVSPTSGGTDHVIDGIDTVSPTGDGTDHVVDGDGGIDGGNVDLFASEEEDNVPLTQLQLNASLASGQSAGSVSTSSSSAAGLASPGGSSQLLPAERKRKGVTSEDLTHLCPAGPAHNTCYVRKFRNG